MNNTLSDVKIHAMERRLIDMTNGTRSQCRLPQLAEWDVLSHYARLHSQSMADGKVDFGHGGFEQRAEAIKRNGAHRAFAENVAFNYLVDDPLTTALNGWLKSQNHRENLLGDFDEIGIGIAYDKQGRCFITQLFAKRIR